MSITDKIQDILNKNKPPMLDLVCTNFWCKAMFRISEKDYNENKAWFGQCKKCRSMSNDLSGGVTNNGTKTYAGDRFEDLVHEKVYNHFNGKDI